MNSRVIIEHKHIQTGIDDKDEAFATFVAATG